jgi:hypothetical protein
VGQNFDTSQSCDQATLIAYEACLDQLSAADNCDSGDQPPPPPPSSCAGSGSIAADQCSLSLSCSDGVYNANCYLITETQSYCDCTSSMSTTSFDAEVPIEQACDYAAKFCGFPY